MRSIFVAVLMSLSWCDSLGDGCVPLYKPVAAGDTADTQISGPFTSSPTTGATTSGGETAGTMGTEGPGTLSTTTTGTATSAGASGSTAGSNATDTTAGEESLTSDPQASSGTTTCGDSDFDPGLEECEPDVTGTGTTDGTPGHILGCEKDKMGECHTVVAVDLAAGEMHACVLSSNGRVQCWGGNAELQGGAGAFEAVPGPDQLPLDATDGDDTGGMVTNGRIFAGGRSTCLVAANAKTWCWGDASADIAPVIAAGTYSAMAISDRIDGDWFICGIDSATKAPRCWGDMAAAAPNLFGTAMNCASTLLTGNDGAMNDADAAPRNLVAAATPMLAAGSFHACLALETNDMACLGLDSWGNACDQNIGKPKCMSENKSCPLDCGTDLCGFGKVNSLAVRKDLTCRAAPGGSLVSCEGLPKDKDMVTLDFGTGCGQEPFQITRLALTDQFVCASNQDDELCCRMFVGAPIGLVKENPDDSPVKVRKLAAQSDRVLVLTDTRRVLQVEKDINGVDWLATEVALHK